MRLQGGERDKKFWNININANLNLALFYQLKELSKE